MAKVKTEKGGCGCASIPILPLLLLLGGGWWAVHQGYASALLDRVGGGQQLLSEGQNLINSIAGDELVKVAQPQPVPNATMEPTFSPPPDAPAPPPAPVASSTVVLEESAPPDVGATTAVTAPESPIAANKTTTPTDSKATESVVASEVAAAPAQATQQKKIDSASLLANQTPWEKKQIRGIYLSRYQVTNNATEKMIRDRVRYYKSQGINTIIHGVWGNGCTMYKSQVMQQTLGFDSCPNLFKEQWLDWMLDEAKKQNMQIHAYFEKGIKLDENSPIFDLAIEKKWLVPGVDKTYSKVDHYVLDMEVPEVATFFKEIVVEFVQRYPEIDAVQWDDYLGYHAELPGQVDRTAQLTKFVQEMAAQMKQANPNVSFDICHHNPYWAKRYFAADWENWNVDRAFIQVYNDPNFEDELGYVRAYNGVAIADNQLHRLGQIVADEEIESVLIFPNEGLPEQAAAQVQAKLQE